MQAGVILAATADGLGKTIDSISLDSQLRAQQVRELHAESDVHQANNIFVAILRWYTTFCASLGFIQTILDLLPFAANIVRHPQTHFQWRSGFLDSMDTWILSRTHPAMPTLKSLASCWGALYRNGKLDRSFSSNARN